MVYAIYEGFFADVEKKLNRIAKKCVKHGNDFKFEIKGEEIKEKKNKDTNSIEYYRFILVDVEGTARVDNWECIAVLERHDNGNIIRKINTNMDIPYRFRHTEDICEHCNSKRQRNKLFIIHNIETDEWKQVGGTCLKLYTNGLNMEYVTAYMDGVTELEEFDGIIGGNCKPCYSVEEVLKFAIEVIDKVGYFNTSSCTPTKTIVSYLIRHTLQKAIEKIDKDFKLTFVKSDFNKEDTDYKVNEIIEHYLNLNDNTDFVHNVKVLLTNGYVDYKDFGFLTYLPEGYARYLNKEKERKAKEEKNKTEKSEHFGEVGKRYKDKELLYIERIATWETQYGTTHIYKIVLTDGIVLTWKTNNCLLDAENLNKITFTIKAHNEYKGQKQTEVTRCKLS